MITITVDDAQLKMLQAAMRAYRNDFGHNEADILRRANALLALLEQSAGVAAH